jgi:hypothetical protein
MCFENMGPLPGEHLFTTLESWPGSTRGCEQIAHNYTTQDGVP